MKINRRKKEFSDAIFNELLLAYLFSQNAVVYKYEVKSFIKKSDRTIYRYFNDLNKTGLFNDGIVSYKTNGETRYSPYKNEKELYDIEKDIPLLMTSFSFNSPLGLQSKDTHINRLTRCSLLLHYLKCLEKRKLNKINKHEFNDNLEKCITLSEEDLEKAQNYYFNEIKILRSKKTFKRDLYLVLSVMYYISDK